MASALLCAALAVSAVAGTEASGVPGQDDTVYYKELEPGETAVFEADIGFDNSDGLVGNEEFRRIMRDDISDNGAGYIVTYGNADTGLVWAGCDNSYLELLEDIRDACLQREASVEVEYTFTDATDDGFTDRKYADFVEAMAADIFMHTGAPTEGDYLWRCELKWTASGKTVTKDADRADTYTVNFTYTFAWRTTFEQEQELAMAVDGIIGSFGWGTQTTDYTKVCDVYGWITDNVDYDYDSLALEDAGEDCPLIYTAYAAVIDGKAVCQGYSSAMYMMLLEGGVDTRYVRGYTGSYGKGSSHCWNIVKIGGGGAVL